MWRRASKSSSAPRSRLGCLLMLTLGLWPRSAGAQACCAGASAITPGRLELHEQALVGAQLRAAWQLGTYSTSGDYRPRARGGVVLDTEQDLFVALRVLRRGQFGVLAPVLESYRHSAAAGAELGGGIGDVNLNARYDFVWGRQLGYWPGIAALLGVTLPSGRAPEMARKPLASDATGIGTTQVTLGIALERPLDDWLISLNGLLAKRAPRSVHGVKSELGTQLSAVLALGYTFLPDASAAVLLTYLHEGNARIDGRVVEGSGRKQLRVSAAFSVALSDTTRAQVSFFLDPALAGFGQNLPASTGGACTIVRSWL